MRTSALALVASTLILAGCAISTQQEVQMGQQEAAQVEQQLPMLQDPAVVGYVNALGQEIASKTSRADLQWRFGVVNTDVVNAFALPGGFVYVNRGAIARAEKMDELASVLSHEIEHVEKRHSVKQLEKQQGTQVGVTLACVLTGVCNSSVANAAINVGGSALFAKFSRTDEIAADEGGFQNLIAAGINPEGQLTFFEKLLAEEQQSGGSSASSSWFATHPGTQDRIADIKRMLSQVPQSKLNQLTVNTQAFNAMKARLAQLPPAPQVQGQ